MVKPRARGPRARAAPGADFRVVADSAYDWESWVGADGALLWVNPAVTRLVGYTVAECVAMRDYPLPLVDEDDRDWMEELLLGARAGSSGKDLEFRVRRKDGARRWAAMSWQPIALRGRPAGYRSSVRDVHERKRLEARLRQARREAAELERVHRSVLTHLSHQLRSPLHCVLGGIELVRDGGLDERGREWAAVIEEQAGLMLQQVEDLLQFMSRDGAPALRPRRTDLHRLCEQAIDAVRPILGARGVATRYEIASNVPRWVTADADALAQVLGNLLSNAVKFTASGVISLYVSCARSGEVVLSVRDTGCGIPAAVIPRVKEPFFQGAEAGARSGVGLGLSVVERLVVQMQGRVTVESVVRRGTVVSVTLPLPLAGPPASSGRDLEESPLRVLVVDDSAPARELAVAAVTALGGIAVAAATAEAAHRLALAGQFDVVLLDYRLADADGLAVARDLRRDLAEVGRRTIIVLLTADAFVEARVGDPDCPVDLVVRKPLRREHLREVLLGAASGQLVAARAEWREESPTSRVLDASVVRELRQSRDGSGQTLFERLGRKVLAQVGTALAQLEASRGGLVAPAVAALAHRAKGDCLTVGARRAARAAGELEDAALGGTEEVACEALEALLVAWADARVAMEDTFDAERPPRSDV